MRTERRAQSAAFLLASHQQPASGPLPAENCERTAYTRKNRTAFFYFICLSLFLPGLFPSELCTGGKPGFPSPACLLAGHQSSGADVSELCIVSVHNLLAVQPHNGIAVRAPPPVQWNECEVSCSPRTGRYTALSTSAIEFSDSRVCFE